MCHCLNKCLLITINTIFLIAGAGLTAVSIWVLVSQGTMFDFLKVLTKDVNVDRATMDNYINSASTLKAAAGVAVGFGALSVVIGFCGCVGAIKKNSCLLIFYAVMISLILVAEIAGAIAAGVFKNEIGQQLKPRLSKIERDHFLPLNMSLSSNGTDAVITDWINYLQVSLECCGVTNMTDITANGTLWSRSNPMFNNKVQVVPVTCCKMKSNRGDLLAKRDWNNVRNYLEDMDCPNTGSTATTLGCYTKIDELISTYSLPVIIVCASVAAFEIFCVIIAACMVRKIRNSGTMV